MSQCRLLLARKRKTRGSSICADFCPRACAWR